MGRRLSVLTVVLMAVSGACAEGPRTTGSTQTTGASAPSTTTTWASAGTVIDIALPVPGLLVAVGSEILDLSTADSEPLFDLGSRLLAPPMAVDGGFVVLEESPEGTGRGILRLVDRAGDEVRRFSTGADSVAVNQSGDFVAWAEPSVDGRTTTLTQAVVSDGRKSHETSVGGFATVVGFGGANVVLSMGDGAEASAAAWVPPTGVVVRARDNAQVTNFGRALDAGDGEALLTIGDGVCPAVADVTATGHFANARKIPCSGLRVPPLGAVSLWLRYQYVLATEAGISIAEFGDVHDWQLAGDIEDLRPVGPVAAVVVARASHGQSIVFFCQRHGCTTAATVQSEKPVQLVRRTSATRGPIQARRLELHPARVRAGGTVDVRGFDHCPAREIVFAMEAAAGEHDAPIVGKATADLTGAITEEVHIPAGTAPGEYLLMTVSVRDESTPEFDCLRRNSSAMLTVEP